MTLENNMRKAIRSLLDNNQRLLDKPQQTEKDIGLINGRLESIELMLNLLQTGESNGRNTTNN
jgi:hypothetical protein